MSMDLNADTMKTNLYIESLDQYQSGYPYTTSVVVIPLEQEGPINRMILVRQVPRPQLTSCNPVGGLQVVPGEALRLNSPVAVPTLFEDVFDPKH